MDPDEKLALAVSKAFDKTLKNAGFLDYENELQEVNEEEVELQKKIQLEKLLLSCEIDSVADTIINETCDNLDINVTDIVKCILQFIIEKKNNISILINYSLQKYESPSLFGLIIRDELLDEIYTDSDRKIIKLFFKKNYKNIYPILIK